jgi:putative two-component system response regulator
VLVVDDNESARRLLERLLVQRSYRVRVAAGGHDALALVQADPPDLVLTDLQMPGGDGLGLCRTLKTSPATRLIPVVIMTGLDEAGTRMRAIETGADDFLSKPIEPSELIARVRSLVSLKRFTDDLDNAEVVLRSLALTIEARDAYTGGHCERLGDYAVALGTELGLAADELIALRRGGYFHDIGKIAVPDAILLKAGPLTAEEYERVKTHTVIGESLCGDLRALRRVKPIVRWHHERIDGSGYPDGLTGDAIPLAAQIIGIVDLFDAMTTTRPYRPAQSRDQAFQELQREASISRRRPDLVERFIAVMTRTGSVS